MFLWNYEKRQKFAKNFINLLLLESVDENIAKETTIGSNYQKSKLLGFELSDCSGETDFVRINEINSNEFELLGIRIIGIQLYFLKNLFQFKASYK